MTLKLHMYIVTKDRIVSIFLPVYRVKMIVNNVTFTFYLHSHLGFVILAQIGHNYTYFSLLYLVIMLS